MKNNKKLPHGKTAALDCDGVASQATFGERKLLKVVCGMGLAVLMGAMAFLGAACTPNSAATSGPQGAQGAAGTADGGSNTSPSNPFNLSPETDPTLFTTQSGINIKFGGATGTVASGGLTGYSYVTMGTYNGSPVNWVIIGYNSSLSYLFSGEVIVGGNGLLDDTIDNSPAGEAIKNNNNYMAYGVQNDTELHAGEVLVISQNIISKGPYAGSSGNYNSSSSKNSCQSLYDNDLGLSDAYKSLIQPQNLTNTYYNGSSTSNNQYIFLLAGLAQNNFFISTYLNTNALRNVGAEYYLRTGTKYSSDWKIYSMYAISKTGALESSDINYTDGGLRPAMVLKLM